MKYRGKRIDNGELVYGYPYQATDWSRAHNEIDQIVDDMGTHHDVEESVSIYFGKKDKNGKEIYTNDKVKYINDIFEVKYDTEGCYFSLFHPELKITLTFLNIKKQDLEIITQDKCK